MIKRIRIIFFKELKDVLRDRRTLLMMVVIPMLLVPLMMMVVTKVMEGQADEAASQQIRVAIVGQKYAPSLVSRIRQDDLIIVITGIPEDSLTSMTNREEIDAGVVIAPTFGARVYSDKQGKITLYYKASAAFDIPRTRLTEIVEDFDKEIVEERVNRLNLDSNLFNAIKIDRVDVASVQEKLGKLAGGFLPYIFIIFGFMGSLYPGLDLGAGEKERGTLETLLSSPANRRDIVFGKFLVVMLAGIATSLIAMFGMYLAVKQFPDIPADVLAVIMEMLGLKMVLMLLTLILPVAALFSAVILALSIYARSFKEAQSIVSPLNIVIIIPALIGTFPGIELNANTALVPILNVSLAAKEMLAGTINYVHLSEVYLSLFALAGLALWGCTYMFSKESVLFRG